MEVDYKNVLTIRQQVMYPDKDVDFVKLEDDDKAIHIGYFIEEKPVSIVSLFLEENKLQFRKFATLPQYQKHGYGSKLIEWIIGYAKEMNFDCVWCNSRYEKKEFYKKFGFEETPTIFERNNLKYIILENKLL